MKLLILGGTADARHICQQLHDNVALGSACNNPLQLVYSVAGLVRMPKVNAQVISGGFTQFGGMQQYLQDHNISGVIDATHPYASQIGAHALAATQARGVPLWRFLRPPWQAAQGDMWVECASRHALFEGLQKYTRVLLSVGQVSAEELAWFSPHTAIFLRTAAQPAITLPEHVTWLKAVGPFSLEEEQKLLKRIQVQTIASKNSGGDAASAKLQVARQLDLPVYMLQRPTLTKALASHSFGHIQTLLDAVMAWLHSQTKTQP